MAHQGLNRSTVRQQFSEYPSQAYYRAKKASSNRLVGYGVQWRRYVEAQRRVPPLGKKENKQFLEKEIREILIFAKAPAPRRFMFLGSSYKKPDAWWLLAILLRGVPPLNWERSKS